MNKSILSLLICGGLIFSTFSASQSVQAQGFSFPAEMNKSFTPLSIPAGGVSRLQVTVYNPNAFDLTNASWTDDLAGVQPGIFLADPVNVSNPCGGSVSAEPGGTKLSLSGGRVPKQTGSTPGSCTVSVDVTSTTPWNLINTIPAGTLRADGNGATISNTSPASATLHVGSVRSPAISKSFSPNTMLVGQTSQLTVRIRNNDPGAALSQASLTDSLPAGVKLADPVSPNLSGCGDSASVTGNNGDSSFTLNNAEIQAGSTCSIRVNVTSAESGIYTNTIPAGALKTMQGLTNGAPATSRLNVQDISLAKKFSPSSFQSGGRTTLTITLKNPTGSSYTGIRLSDTLPGEVLTVVPDSAVTTCGGTVTIDPPRTVTLSGGRVPAGAPDSPGTCTITFEVTAPTDAEDGSYKNTIPEGALESDQGITNGSSTSSWVRVYRPGAGLEAGKSFSPSTITAGDNSRLRIKIPAPGDTDLTTFSLVDNLPASVTVSNSSPATFSNCGDSATLTAPTGAASITLANATILAGKTCQIDVYVTSSTLGVHTNVIHPGDISNDQDRTIPSDISDNLTVQAASDFGISKKFTPPSVSPGGISTLTITLENRNTVPLVNAAIVDPLPGDAANGVIIAPNPHASTTCAGGTVTAAPGSQEVRMTGGTVPARLADVPGTCTITVDVQGMGALTKRTNTIPVENASATLQGTDTVVNPTKPAQADLVIGELVIGVVKGFNPLTVFGGSASTLSIEIINSNLVAIGGIAFTDSMPEGMIVADPPNPDVGECGGTISAAAGNGSFSYSGGSLPASSSCFLTIRVTMTVNGNLTNTIQANALTTSSGVTNPRPAEATLTNLPGASISKAFSPNPIAPGEVSKLIFTIRNTGTVALSGMGFKDKLPGDLPIGLEIAGSPEPQNTCGGTLTAQPGTQQIELVNGVLGFNASCTIVVPVTSQIAGSYTNTLVPGTLTTNEGATNHDETTDTLVVGGSPGGNNSGGNKGKGGKNKGNSSGEEVSGVLIPVTGFAPNRVTKLDPIARPAYDATSIHLEIPVLKVRAPIVGVQITKGGWDISWLQDQVGWLNGTAYPTWKGNSVLTAHAVNADGKPGLFSRLKYLGKGEFIYIYEAGYRYTYMVTSSQPVPFDDISVFEHQEQSVLTLVTCEDYDVKTNTYLSRVMVRARLVDVRLDQ